MPNPLTKQDVLDDINALITELEPPADDRTELELIAKMVAEMRHTFRSPRGNDAHAHTSEALGLLYTLRRDVEAGLGTTTGG